VSPTRRGFLKGTALAVGASFAYVQVSEERHRLRQELERRAALPILQRDRHRGGHAENVRRADREVAGWFRAAIPRVAWSIFNEG